MDRYFWDTPECSVAELELKRGHNTLKALKCFLFTPLAHGRWMPNIVAFQHTTNNASTVPTDTFLWLERKGGCFFEVLQRKPKSGWRQEN